MSARPDFKFADGLRGVAALTVAIYHAYLFTGRSGEARHELAGVGRVVMYGHFAVPLFIVLSGFVLMLPVATRPGLELSGGTAGFLKRRARRILPPYYAALALFLLLILVVPVLQEPRGTAWDNKLPVSAGGIISHVLLLHNLRSEWAYLIDGPMWSVATEWQIYLAMPLLLLPIWRKFGPLVAVATAVVLGPAVTLLIPQLWVAHPWYLGLFAFGMLAAWIVTTGWTFPGLHALIVGLLAGTALLFAAAPDLVQGQISAAEMLLGAATAGGLVLLARQDISGRLGPVGHVLESRPLVWLGLFSYSIYLIHSPLLGLGNLLLLEVEMSIGTRLAVQVLLVLPLALACSYVFHRLVERPFQTSHQTSHQAKSQDRPLDVTGV